MAYKETRAERRKAQRRIAAFEEQLKAGTGDKKKLQKQIRSLQKRVEATYTYSPETGKKIRTTKQVEKAVKALAGENVRAGMSFGRFRASNNATRIELNRGTVGKSNKYTAGQVKAFYRATEKDWVNERNIEFRNEAIMAAQGTSSLEQAVEQVLSQPENQRLANAYDILLSDDATEEEKANAIRVLSDNEDEEVASPAYLARTSTAVLPTIAP